MAKNNIKLSNHRGKAVGLFRRRHGQLEKLEGTIVGFQKDSKGAHLIISQDGLFQHCRIGFAPGCWMYSWVGKNPGEPKTVQLLREEPKPRAKADQEVVVPTRHFAHDEDEGLNDFDLQIMAENIKSKRGPGRPPKADNGPVDLRYGVDERPDDLFDLTAGISLGIGLEDDAYEHLSFEMADIY